MSSEVLNKSIKLIIIPLIILGVVIFYFLIFNKADKTDKQGQNIASTKIPITETKEECLARVKNLKLDQLSSNFLQIINSNDYNYDDYILPPGVLRSYYTSMLIMKNYHCQLNKVLSKKDEYNKTYSQAKDYINNLLPGDEFKDIRLDYLNYLSNNSFYSSLISVDLGQACPDDLSRICYENREINESAFPTDKDWCNNICEKLYLYEKNKNKFNEEVINFKDWNEDIPLKSQYFWRARVAYRFGGEESALKLCDNLPINVKDKNFCIRAVVRDNIKGMECDDAFEELIQISCSE